MGWFTSYNIDGLLQLILVEANVFIKKIPYYIYMIQ